MNYRECVFRELRIYADDKAGKTDQPEKDTRAYPLAAVTLNENLKNVGFVMDPDTLKTVSETMTPEEMKDMQDDIARFAGKVDAEPMYPGFPQQVLDIDEAQFRLDQLCHYFSTYGIEILSGNEIRKGWLPCADEKKVSKEEFNGFSADLKKIHVALGDDAWAVPVRIVLSRRSRMTEPEKQIAAEAVRHLPKKTLSAFSIPFKENIVPVFEIAMQMHSIALAHVACQHPGDAIKCLEAYLKHRHYRMPTSQKRLAVAILESYNAYSFRENLCISSSKSRKADNVLRGISFTRFSRNAAHRKAVDDMRDGRLRSWASETEELLALRSPKALRKLAERPGMALRMVRRLISLGYDRSSITDILRQNAAQLSISTLVAVIDSTELSEMLKPVLEARLVWADTPLRGKKIFLDEQEYDLDHSFISKSEEGGYVRSGMAFRIPDSARRIRFFVYWNDARRIDVDLHAFFTDICGASHHVGWNGSYKDMGVATSGDITHSDAAEYIDIDMVNADIDKVFLSIDLFSGKDFLGDIDETLAGVMGIRKVGMNIAHYDPRSCFVSDRLVSKRKNLRYGIIDVQNRYIRIERTDFSCHEHNKTEANISVREYISILAATQNAEFVSSREDADIVLSVAKGGDCSLIDENFFMDC